MAWEAEGYRARQVSRYGGHGLVWHSTHNGESVCDGKGHEAQGTESLAATVEVTTAAIPRHVNASK